MCWSGYESDESYSFVETLLEEPPCEKLLVAHKVAPQKMLTVFDKYMPPPSILVALIV